MAMSLQQPSHPPVSSLRKKSRSGKPRTMTLREARNGKFKEHLNPPVFYYWVKKGFIRRQEGTWSHYFILLFNTHSLDGLAVRAQREAVYVSRLLALESLVLWDMGRKRTKAANVRMRLRRRWEPSGREQRLRRWSGRLVRAAGSGGTRCG